MKKLFAVLTATLVLSQACYAGLITHNDYTSGTTITAAAQNTNENAIVNEFNGNINAANLASNAVTTAKITDANVTTAKLSQVLQDTFTLVGQMGAYRRPVLKFISVTTVDVEANTGTANQTCIQFPDQFRCVTENTGSTSVNRRFIITEAASNSATKNSGLRSGYVETANTWYALYAWKTSDVATDFVVVGDTLQPTQANYATLNTVYGTNSWVYLGLIRNGDNSAATTDILAFFQSGAVTYFTNSTTGNANVNTGTRLATTAGAGTLSYSCTSGFGATDIPSTVVHVYWAWSVNSGSSTTQFRDSTASNALLSIAPGTFASAGRLWYGVGTTVATVNGSSVGMDINLAGFADGVLGVGSNPQL